MALVSSDEIKNWAAAFEAERHKVAIKFAIFFFGGIVAFILGLVFFFLAFLNEGNASSFNVLKVLGFIFLIPGIVMIVVGLLINSSFKKKVRSVVEQRVLDSLFPQRTVDPNRGLMLGLIMKPGFFNPPDRYIGRDYMSSSYDGIPFEKASYNLQRRETRSDGKNTYTEWVTYAEGTMYHFTFERDFGQVVKVLEKSGYLTFGSTGLTKVETEYILFNKKFRVLASDETTVFYLLTPQIQEKIMDLEGNFAGHFFLAFMGNELFIAVDDSHRSISVPLFKKITEEVMAHIYSVYAIPKIFIELLGLNKNKFKKDAGGTAV
jgi:hypothetical protein